MSAPDPSRLNASLRLVHYSVLGSLIVCALVIGAWSGASGAERAGELPQGYTIAAVLLGGASILFRRSVVDPGADPRRAVWRTLASLILAGGLGLLGVAAAVREGDGTAGLLYAVAGGLLAVRPPPRFGLAAGSDGAAPEG
jgi:hypothetical protein